MADLTIEGCGRGHVHDGTPAAVVVHRLGLGHRRRGLGEHVERPDQVHVDDEGELVERERVVLAIDGTPGEAEPRRVHQRSQRTHVGRGGDRFLGVLDLGDVALHEEAVELGGQRLALLFLEVGDHDTRSRFGEKASRGFADSRRTAGDDGGASFEVHTGHQAPILSMMVALAMPPPSHMVWRP